MVARIFNVMASVSESATTGKDCSQLWLGLGAVIAAFVLPIIGCCLCSCFLCHISLKRQSRECEGEVEATNDTTSLISNTAVGGLPTYEEAMEQRRMLGASSLAFGNSYVNPPPPYSKHPVEEFFKTYREDDKK